MKLIPTNPRARKVFFAVLALLIIGVLLWFYTYVFTRKSNKVIYQDASRRVYLTNRREYKPGREMWDMTYEDRKTGARYYIMANSKKGYSEKEMVRRVLNTFENGLPTASGGKKSFDSVDRTGVTITLAKSDIHSNLVPQKDIGDLIPAGLKVRDADFDLLQFR
jgi:hypothetical protein